MSKEGLFDVVDCDVHGWARREKVKAGLVVAVTTLFRL